MEHVWNDHKACANQHENGHKLCDGTEQKIIISRSRNRNYLQGVFSEGAVSTGSKMEAWERGTFLSNK